MRLAKTSAQSGMRNYSLNLAPLQPMHVDVDAICEPQMTAQTDGLRLVVRHCPPSLSEPEVPNSMIALLGIRLISRVSVSLSAPSTWWNCGQLGKDAQLLGCRSSN